MMLLRRTALKSLLRDFVEDEKGHDVIEYTLLMAFLTLASAAMYIGAGGSVVTIWSVSNSLLNNVSTEIPRS